MLVLVIHGGIYWRRPATRVFGSRRKPTQFSLTEMENLKNTVEAMEKQLCGMEGSMTVCEKQKQEFVEFKKNLLERLNSLRATMLNDQSEAERIKYEKEKLEERCKQLEKQNNGLQYRIDILVKNHPLNQQ